MNKVRLISGLLSGLLTASLAGALPAAWAAQATTDLQIKATVTSTCGVAALGATELDFGSIASTATNTATTARLQVTCTNGTSYKVALDLGHHADNGTRRMISGSNYLPYHLYRSGGTSEPWTDQLGQTYSGIGSGAVQEITVYGVVPSANVPAGAYADTVTATLEY